MEIGTATEHAFGRTAIGSKASGKMATGTEKVFSTGQMAAKKRASMSMATKMAFTSSQIKEAKNTQKYTSQASKKVVHLSDPLKYNIGSRQ